MALPRFKTSKELLDAESKKGAADKLRPEVDPSTETDARASALAELRGNMGATAPTTMAEGPAMTEQKAGRPMDQHAILAQLQRLARGGAVGVPGQVRR